MVFHSGVLSFSVLMSENGVGHECYQKPNLKNRVILLLLLNLLGNLYRVIAMWLESLFRALVSVYQTPLEGGVLTDDDAYGGSTGLYGGSMCFFHCFQCLENLTLSILSALQKVFLSVCFAPCMCFLTLIETLFFTVIKRYLGLCLGLCLCFWNFTNTYAFKLFGIEFSFILSPSQ